MVTYRSKVFYATNECRSVAESLQFSSIIYRRLNRLTTLEIIFDQKNIIWYAKLTLPK